MSMLDDRREDTLERRRRGSTTPTRLAVGVVVALACLAVIVAGSTPNLIFIDDPLADTVLRKIGHVLAFMAIAFGAGVTVGVSLQRSHAAWLILTGAAALAVLDEVIQSRVAGRLSSPLDVAVDILGAAAGILAWLLFERWRAARS
jgi:VanZ family protein